MFGLAFDSHRLHNKTNVGVNAIDLPVYRIATVAIFF
jgi:hypothetical protein